MSSTGTRTSHIVREAPSTATREGFRAATFSRLTVPVGRALFSAIFLMAGVTHFSSGSVGYAAQAGIPAPGFLVPASGLLAAAGGASILLGYRARIGAWLIVLFLVPVTLSMHRFWTIEDPMMAGMDQAMFMKNLAIIGAALVMARLGAGPVSLDARAGRS